jgi:hypothetical protein
VSAPARFDTHPLTWTTTHGDTVELYSRTKMRPNGDPYLVWKWRRIHHTGLVLATGDRAWPKKGRAVWEARRVNPPHPWFESEQP